MAYYDPDGGSFGTWYEWTDRPDEERGWQDSRPASVPGSVGHLFTIREETPPDPPVSSGGRPFQNLRPEEFVTDGIGLALFRQVSMARISDYTYADNPLLAARYADTFPLQYGGAQFGTLEQTNHPYAERILVHPTTIVGGIPGSIVHPPRLRQVIGHGGDPSAVDVRLWYLVDTVDSGGGQTLPLYVAPDGVLWAGVTRSAAWYVAYGWVTLDAAYTTTQEDVTVYGTCSRLTIDGWQDMAEEELWSGDLEPWDRQQSPVLSNAHNGSERFALPDYRQDDTLGIGWTFRVEGNDGKTVHADKFMPTLPTYFHTCCTIGSNLIIPGVGIPLGRIDEDYQP
jgi:hypothetical protein